MTAEVVPPIAPRDWTAEPADVLLLTITGGVPDAPGALHLAIVNRSGFLDGLRKLLRPRPATIVERDVEAVPL